MATSTELATVERADLALSPISTVADAKMRLAALHEFVKSVMIEGHDYGVIPGTDKPTLYKPGAEKLGEMYGLAATYEVTRRVEEWERGFWHYEVRCRLHSRRDGGIVGEGVGSCNSMETRYRWRTEWSNVPEHQTPAGDAWRLVYVKKQGKKVWQRRVENEDRWDLPNTLLKMAKKRGHVDATLSVTRSSGLFTQDLEDLRPAEDGDDDGGRQHAQPRDAPAASVATEEARACPSCDQPMNLRSGTTRDGRPYSAWFCATKCGQKPIWLSERKADAPASSRPVQATIVTAPPAGATDRLLSAAEVKQLRTDVTSTFEQQGWGNDHAIAAVKDHMREIGVASVDALTLHQAEAFRRWAREAASGGVPDGGELAPDYAAAHFAEL